MGFGGAGNVLTQLVEELVSEGAVKGNLKGGGVHWVPAAYASAQQGAVSAFYSQNGWVGYDLVKRWVWGLFFVDQLRLVLCCLQLLSCVDP